MLQVRLISGADIYTELIDIVEAMELIREGYDPYATVRRIGKRRLVAIDMPMLKALRRLSRDWFRIALIRKALLKLGTPVYLSTPFAIAIYLVEEGLLREEDLEKISQFRLVGPIRDIVEKVATLYKESIRRIHHITEQAMLEYYMPRWLACRLSELIGSELLQLCRAMRRKTTWVRVNTLKADIDVVKRSLEDQGFVVEKDEDFPFLLRLLKGDEAELRKCDLIRKGYCFIQDKGSVISVACLDPQPGDIVIDYCAAPGMKTTLIAQFMENRGAIVAIDISRRRISKLKYIIRLSGASNIIVLQGDSRRLKLLKVDKALVDPPCTSTGALSKDATIALRLKRRHIRRYSRTQSLIMENVCKQATTIVYSVCSLLPEEGEELIDRLMEKGLRPLRSYTKASRGYPGFRCSSLVMRLFPHLHGTDGFFIAKLKAE